MQDCVIGCCLGYGWDQVRVWARSLRMSGFAGRKVALLRAPGPGCGEGLLREGFEVVDFSQAPVAGAPHVERFSQLRRFLFTRRQHNDMLRWVIATDVRDVCFQRDPMSFLARFDPPRLVLSPEGLRYADAAWNASNLAEAFGPAALETLAYAAPNNAGVLAGGHWAMEGLALLIEQLSRGTRAAVSDQAALNLLAEGMAGALWVHRAGSAEPWACQAGVMADPQRIALNRPNLLGPEPVWRDGMVLTATGEPYAIVHQYDRVPPWEAAITARYGG
jgi:hypothetical protein